MDSASTSEPGLRRRLSVLLLLFVLTSACRSGESRQPIPLPDITTRVKMIASQAVGGTYIVGDTTTYTAYFYNTPRGYKNIVTLVERDDEPLGVSVWIYEKIHGTHRLTLMIDEPLDGRLDYAMSASGPSTGDVYQLINSRPRTRNAQQIRSTQPAYDALLREIRQTAMYVTSAVKPR